MARCANCGERLEAFFPRGRKLGGAAYCLRCAPEVMARRRDETVASIFQGPPPRVVFTAPVLSRDLDSPRNYRRFAGSLLFTDKGIIFAQYAEWNTAHAYAEAVGPVGAVLAELADARRRKAALREVPTAAFDDAFGTECTPSVFDGAVQVFYFPLAGISKVKASGAICFVRADGRNVRFRWAGPRETIRPVRHLLDAYAGAVKGRQDVLASCRQVRGT